VIEAMNRSVLSSMGLNRGGARADDEDDGEETPAPAAKPAKRRAAKPAKK
jgi:hypothetical protein